jgi:hypothetical protein
VDDDIVEAGLQWLSGKLPNKEQQEIKVKYYDLYYAVSGYNVEAVRILLTEGLDPDYCYSAGNGWPQNNPLSVVVIYVDSTYYKRMENEPIPETTRDIELLKTLKNAGVDINKRPYIWELVWYWNNDPIYRIQEEPHSPYPSIRKLKEEDVPFKIEVYVNDVNRLLAAFLKEGADPDKPGHSYPYRPNDVRVLKTMTDEEAETYFAKGTRPINEAIKKGMWWESQVDLLLQYTTLDEDSLKAAEESGDPAMVEKITRLWQEQNAMQ